MITDSILSLIYFFLTGIIDLLPVGNGFPSQVDSAFNMIGQIVNIFNDIIPVGTIFDVIIFLIIPTKLTLFTIWTLIFLGRFMRGV